MFIRSILILLACMLPARADDDIIKIVSSLPRTGSAKGQTDTIVNGIKMALEEAGKKVGKFRIEYKDLDDAAAERGRWDADAEYGNAKKAVQDADVMVYLGPYNSGAAAVSMPILNKANLLMISPACSWPGLTKTGFEQDEPDKYRPSGKVNFLRVVASDELQGLAAAKYAVEDLKLKKVYILDDGEVYGKGEADVFAASVKKLGLKVLGRETINEKQPDFLELMRKLDQMKPDAVYFGGTSQSGAPAVARDMAKAGLKSILLLPDGCYEDAFVQGAGEGTFKNLKCYISIGGVPPSELPSEAGKRFFKCYKDKFKAEPEAYAVFGYEAARVVLEAIRKAGKKDRDAIREAALGIKDFETAVGTISFDKNGDVHPGLFSIAVIEGKDPKFLKTITIK